MLWYLKITIKSGIQIPKLRACVVLITVAQGKKRNSGRSRRYFSLKTRLSPDEEVVISISSPSLNFPSRILRARGS